MQAQDASSRGVTSLGARGEVHHASFSPTAKVTLRGMTGRYPRRTLMRMLLVLAVLLGGAAAATAQTQADPIDTDSRFAEVMVVTAALEEEPARRLSASVDVIEAI